MSARSRRIETARLVLEPIPLATAQALVAGRSVPGLIAGSGWPKPDTLDGMAMDVAADDEHRTGWLIVLRDTGEVIGDCGWRGGPDAAGDAEVGYGLAAPFRGQGYGTEALAGLVRWCSWQPGLRRLVAEVLPGNTPSRRLLEGAGFVLLGSVDGHLRYVRPMRSEVPAATGGT
ncbi:MAG: GNAT family N-acetyltransferase [Frankiaceae bacterium]